MDKVLLAVNNELEMPGTVIHILEDHSIPFDMVDLSKGNPFPDPHKYKALFVFGGPNSANDHDDQITRELARLKEAVDSHIPVLGICLGLQTLVKANGGAVVKSPLRELGWRDPQGSFFEIQLTRDGEDDPLFYKLPKTLITFQLHGEAVELEPNMKLLAKGAYCENQVVKVGNNAYGLQCHFELNEELLDKWIEESSDLAGFNKSALRADYIAVKGDYEKHGRQIFENFLRLAEVIH